jgi:peptidoglycan/LPS O-acetylase OafA/YrhL
LPPLLLVVPLALPFVFHLSRRSIADRALGELSYPVYLVHYLWVFVAAGLGGPVWTGQRGVVVLGLTLLSAVALWRWVGRPFERIRAANVAPADAVVGAASLPAQR